MPYDIAGGKVNSNERNEEGIQAPKLGALAQERTQAHVDIQDQHMDKCRPRSKREKIS
jgi:hypothetical protein